MTAAVWLHNTLANDESFLLPEKKEKNADG
jgi:hypothetical protein